MNILNIQGDEPTMRVMTWILEEAGYQVFNASGPYEATCYIIPDLIVINTNMPVHEKRACVQALRMLVPSVRIIDLAIDASEVAHDTGADAYLAEHTWQATWSEMWRHVERAISSHTVVTSTRSSRARRPKAAGVTYSAETPIQR